MIGFIPRLAQSANANLAALARDPEKYGVVLIPTVTGMNWVKMSEFAEKLPGYDMNSFRPAEAVRRNPNPVQATRLASAPGQGQFVPVAPKSPLPASASMVARIDDAVTGPQPGFEPVRRMRNVTPRNSQANRTVRRPVSRMRSGQVQTVEAVDGIGDFLKKAVGVVAPIVGGIFGGPAGAALGSAIGGAVNKPKSSDIVQQAGQPGATFPGAPHPTQTVHEQNLALLARSGGTVPQSISMGMPATQVQPGPSFNETYLLAQQNQLNFQREQQAFAQQQAALAQASTLQLSQVRELAAADRRLELEQQRLADARAAEIRRAELEQVKVQAQITAAQLAAQSNQAQAQLYAQGQQAAAGAQAQIEAAKIAAESAKQAALIQSQQLAAQARAEQTRLAAEREVSARATRTTGLYVAGGAAVIGLTLYLVLRRKR